MIFLRTTFASLQLTIALLLACAAPVVFAVDEDLDHLIPPGYEPEDVQDEQGLWMEIEEYERSLNKSALLIREPDIVNYVNEVVCRVAGDYCSDFRVYVVRNPGFNASMTATGMMQIWTGLILRASSTDELAAVIGHEIAHYTRLHTLSRFRSMKRNAAAGSIFDMGLAVLTGISTPTGQMVAALGVLSFNREQEQEADILGARLMQEAGLDPHASYAVWQGLIQEEQAAAVKRREPGMFSKTHPDAEDRARELEEFVTARYGPQQLPPMQDDPLIRIIEKHYLLLMEDQIDTNRFGRTEEMLHRHSALGINSGLVLYFLGENYRQRGQDGDRVLAMAAYKQSIQTGDAPPEAYKNLGYLQLKNDNTRAAQESFRHYLALKPNASDRAMIEFYLEE